jgi:toxin YoeB
MTANCSSESTSSYEIFCGPPFEGVGKPEPLKGDLSGYWSRRINDEHRLVYTVKADDVVMIACRFHYGE